jgi:hypothetical protein
MTSIISVFVPGQYKGKKQKNYCGQNKNCCLLGLLRPLRNVAEVLPG